MIFPVYTGRPVLPEWTPKRTSSPEEAMSERCWAGVPRSLMRRSCRISTSNMPFHSYNTSASDRGSSPHEVQVLWPSNFLLTRALATVTLDSSVKFKTPRRLLLPACRTFFYLTDDPTRAIESNDHCFTHPKRKRTHQHTMVAGLCKQCCSGKRAATRYKSSGGHRHCSNACMDCHGCLKSTETKAKQVS